MLFEKWRSRSGRSAASHDYTALWAIALPRRGFSRELKTPNGLSSSDFSDKLLYTCNLVGTAGSGFGAAGEGYFRISAFNSRENVEEAMQGITEKFKV